MPDNSNRHELERQIPELRNQIDSLNSRYRALVDNSLDSILLTNPETGDIIYANPAAADLFQMSEEEIIRAGRSTLVDTADSRLAEALAESKRNGRFTGELAFKKSDGTLFAGQISSALFHDTRGEPRSSMIIRDLTPIRTMEESLRESEERFLSAFDHAPIGITLVSPAGKCLKANQAVCDLLGYAEEELKAMTFHDITHPDDLADDKGYVEQMLSGKISTYQLEKRYLHKQGHMLWALLSVSLIRDGDNRPSYFISQIVDITQRRQAEEKIRRNAARLAALVEILKCRPEKRQDYLAHALDQAIFLSDSRIGCIYQYDETSREFSINTWSDEVIKECNVSNFPDRFKLDDTGFWGEVVRQRRAVMINNYQAGHPLKKGCPEGRVPLHRFLFVPVFHNEKIVAVLGVADKPRDYDETDTLELTLLMDAVWKAMEAAGSRSELRRIEWLLTSKPPEDSDPYTPPYGDLTELNENGLIKHSLGRRMLPDIVSDYLDLLETSAAVYEKNGDYALGIFSSGWCRFMDTASRKLCRTDDNRDALTGGRWLCHESCWTHNARVAMETGRPVDIACAGGINMYAEPVFAGDKIVGAINFGYGDPPRDTARLNTLADRFEVSREELRRRAEEYETRPPFIIETAKRGLAASARLIGEIIERKQAETEREELQQQLLQFQKMESVGRLAGGVAHDFNNMLSVILGHAELAKNNLDPADPIREDLDEILSAGRRSADITRQLLAFARKQNISPQVINLNDLIEGMLKMLRRLIGEDIDFTWHPGAGLWPVRMDPSQVDQILVNLLVNARDAIEGVGRISIETANTVSNKIDNPDRSDFVVGDYVMLSISDNGCGMDEETLNHLFEPFFTTKETGRGTGLGLAMVYDIVRQNNGFIHAFSEPGRGATFKSYLPRHEGEAEPHRPPAKIETDQRYSETIMIVEDETAILRLAKRVLTNLGYTVIDASRPGRALELAAARTGDSGLDLLVTDVIMPEMNGRDLAERLKKTYPGLKVLYMSGYTADVLSQRSIIKDEGWFIQKPFTNQDLAVKVRAVLENDKTRTTLPE